MQDALIERLAAAKFGDLTGGAGTRRPRRLLRDLLAGRSLRRGCRRHHRHVVRGGAAGEKRRSALPSPTETTDAASRPRRLRAPSSRRVEPQERKPAWQQGAFGLGGASTYRNAQAVVPGRRGGLPSSTTGTTESPLRSSCGRRTGKLQSAYYLTTTPWDNTAGDRPTLGRRPASEYPGFEPGTYLALISYGVEGYHRARLGDERSFDTTLNTRLFQPVDPRFGLPTRWSVSERNEYLRGFCTARLEDNPRPGERLEGADKLPFHVDGVTYHLPVELLRLRGTRRSRRASGTSSPTTTPSRSPRTDRYTTTGHRRTSGTRRT